LGGSDEVILVQCNSPRGSELPTDLSSVGERYVLEADSSGLCSSKDGLLHVDFTFSTKPNSLTFTQGIAHPTYWHSVTTSTLTLKTLDGTGYFAVQFLLARQ